MTRVTHRTMQESTLANLQRNLTSMSSLQERLSTGKNINRASDDPTGTVSVLQLRQDLRAAEQYSRNADDGLAWLTTIDTALQTTSAQLRKAQDLTLSALNQGAQSEDSRAAIALELRGIKDSVLGLANTKYLDRSVFAGTTGMDSAYALNDTAAPSGHVYAQTSAAVAAPDSKDGQVLRRIDAATQVRVDIDGRKAFGDDQEMSGPDDFAKMSVFTLLDRVAGLVQTSGEPDLTSINAAYGALKTRMTAVGAALSDVGTNMNRLSSAQDVAEDRKVALSSALSGVEDTDLTETIVQMQMQEVAYKAALGATAKVLQPSLMDFLR